MFEHVGLRQLAVYFERCHELLPPGGRLLNHAISRPPGVSGSTADGRTRFARRSFIDRYVFPDGELHEVGSVISAIQRAGFEARHMETLREHYALTLRAWVANLEANWDACVADAGRGPGAHLAPLHGRVGTPVRGEPDAGAPGAGDQAGRRAQRSAAPSALRVAR